MTLRRALWSALLVVLAALGYTAWLVWQVQDDLRSAESSASNLRAAWQDGDTVQQQLAAADLADSAVSAEAHTSGTWWRLLGHAPLVGDDADGIAAVSRSLEVVSDDVVTPLGEVVESLDSLVDDGVIDLEGVERIQQPVSAAYAGLRVADDDLSAHDSDGYVGPLRTRFDRFADLVHDLSSGLGSAKTAVALLPGMAGAEGPRNYLLIFQNNAEIRATGGMPGSWALLHADGGTLTMTRQGTANDLPPSTTPVLPLSAEEVAVYGKEVGLYFQDPGWTADFPRAAQLWEAHWRQQFPDEHLDGVVALDPVALSYLLDGIGPVTVDGVTLTRDNAVEELLSRPYRDADPDAQNVFFGKAAKATFDAVTRSVSSPVALAQGLDRAADEGRLLVSAFDEQAAHQLAGTRVAGELAGDDGPVPHVDIGLDDLTGSKMSYYLRYHADVDAMTCEGDAQQLAGSVTLSQSISPGQAAQLPVSVTGGGRFGTEPGSQYVMVRVYGPYDGSIDTVSLDGKRLEGVQVQQIHRRPVVSVDVLLSSRQDQVLTWEGSTGPGQTGDGLLRTTPSVVPGSDQQAFGSSC